MSTARVLVTAIGPVFWGTTYIVFTETLPTDHPLLVSALRALPAGLILLAVVRTLPGWRILLPVTTLSLTNIGIFFALLLVSAARLPGGVTATLAACQPLLVAIIAWPLLGRRPTPRQLALAAFGMAGVGLLVLDGELGFDTIGVLAGMGAALSMAIGIVLMERWRDIARPLEMTAWQLSISGVLLLPLALAVEGWPPVWGPQSAGGLAWLVLFGTAVSYWIWITGVQQLGAGASVLAFLSPLVAFVLGVAFLGETLDLQQVTGVVAIFASIWLSMRETDGVSRARPAGGP